MFIEATIDRPAAGGDFIATYQGRIILAHGGIPGERVKIHIRDPEARLWRGQVVEVLEASPHRIDNPCQSAHAGAGCCDWGYIEPQAAQEFKAAIVADCLRRVGHLEAAAIPDFDTVDLHPAHGWRTRARLGVDAQGRAGLRRASSHELVVGTSCAQAAPGLYDDLSHPGQFPVAPMRRGRRGGTAEVFVAVDKQGRRSVVHVSGGGRRRQETVMEGPAVLHEEVLGVEFEIPTTGFWQAHRAAPHYYAQRVQELLHEHNPNGGLRRVFDLYGGVGVLATGALELLDADGEVVSVENYEASSQAGRVAFESRPVRFLTGEVAEVVAGQQPQGQQGVDAVILDPPRAGAGRSAISAIAATAPRTVIHIGCDPATYARDVHYWHENGYRLTQLEAVDAFSLTHHVEVISVLQPR